MKKSDEITLYIRAQKTADAAICKKLCSEINQAMPKATAKMYHAIPVWFIGENAVVGFRLIAKKKGVNLLFWNGQAFDEPELKATGKFEAAEIQFQDVKEINLKNLRRWLKKAAKNVWDFSGLRQREK